MHTLQSYEVEEVVFQPWILILTKECAFSL